MAAHPEYVVGIYMNGLGEKKSYFVLQKSE